MEKGVKTQWHPAFCSAIRLEFREYEEYLEYVNEYNLNSKPLQIDLLVIKKDNKIKIRNNIGFIFKTHNIIEYKSPDDTLDKDTFFKAVGYACLYKASEKYVDAIPFNDVTVTMIRKRYPRKLFEWLKEQGYSIHEQFKGVYYIYNVMGIATQIIVSKHLPKKEQKWLTLLDEKLSKEEAKRAIIQANALNNKAEKEYADSVLQVIISKNRQVFDMLKKEGEDMCEALRELMEPEIREATEAAQKKGLEEGRAKGLVEGLKEGRVKGRAEGRTEGENAFAALVSYLLKDGLIDILEKITKDINLREEYYAKYGVK